MNEDKNLLKQQVDLHYLSVEAAKRLFEEYRDILLYDLQEGLIQGNSEYYNVHIVKVVCGKGFGRSSGVDRGLKEAFLEYFTEKLDDFVYLP